MSNWLKKILNLEDPPAVSFTDATPEQKRALCPVPEPKRPAEDLTWYSLLLPNLIGFFGLFLLEAMGQAAEQLHPAAFSRLAVTGSLMMMLGSAFGTLFLGIEVSRKTKTKEAFWADVPAFVFSIGSDIAAMLLMWSAQLGTRAADMQVLGGFLATLAEWVPITSIIGPPISAILIVIDLSLSVMEAGLYKRSWRQRHDKWEQEYYIPWATRMGDIDVRTTEMYYGISATEPAEQDAVPVEDEREAKIRSFTPEQRQEQLLVWWEENPEWSTAELADALYVSESTIRSDRHAMRNRGLINTSKAGRSTVVEVVERPEKPVNYEDLLLAVRSGELPREVSIDQIAVWSGRDLDTAEHWYEQLSRESL